MDQYGSRSMIVGCGMVFVSLFAQGMWFFFFWDKVFFGGWGAGARFLGPRFFPANENVSGINIIPKKFCTFYFILFLNQKVNLIPKKGCS